MDAALSTIGTGCIEVSVLVISYWWSHNQCAPNGATVYAQAQQLGAPRSGHRLVSRYLFTGVTFRFPFGRMRRPSYYDNRESEQRISLPRTVGNVLGS